MRSGGVFFSKALLRSLDVEDIEGSGSLATFLVGFREIGAVI
jgi:hypothetical protein